MTEQPNTPSLASVEADLFGAVFGFHKKAMTLLRESSLDDEKLNVVADRIKTLLDSATAEMKLTNQVNVKERLEAAYDEVKRLVDQLSGIPDGREKG
jgi:hypothetical protein